MINIEKDIMLIPAEELGKGSSIKIEVLKTPEDLYDNFAWVMANRIKENNLSGEKTTFILPVGPTAQYKRLAEICNREGISCQNLVILNMDEYCLEDGSLVPFDHPLSFRGFMGRKFFSLLDDDKKVKEENKIFPDPKDLDFISRRIEELGSVEICFGGIGINGHIAFNEPPEPGEDIDENEFRNLRTRVLKISRETIVINSIYGTGGNLRTIPPKCVTIGMKEILSSKELHFYLDWHWQQSVIRRTVHGPVTPKFPASYLQTHPNCTITITSEVASLPGVKPK